MTDTKQAFVALFAAYMKDGDARQLFAFIDGQPVDGLRDCLAAYFHADTSQPQRVRSRAVFVRLAVRAVGKDLHFALFADAMIHIARSPWQVHYHELSGGEKSEVDKAIEAQKRKMPPIERKFAENFKSYMTDKRVTLQKMTAFLQPLIAATVQKCVALYIEMSPWYEKGNDEASLQVFFIASYYALRPGEAGYARTYGANIEEDFSVWHTRFHSLRPNLQDQLRTRMKEAAAPAHPAAGEAPGKQKPGTLSADQKQFVQLYRRYVDSGERAAMNNFQRFLVGRSAEALAGYVLVYLDDSAQHYGEPPSHQSSQIFFGTLSAAITKNSAYYAFRVKLLIDTPDTIWNQRFRALDLLQYGKVR
jgi:hypothetical protein